MSHLASFLGGALCCIGVIAYLAIKDDEEFVQLVKEELNPKNGYDFARFRKAMREAK